MSTPCLTLIAEDEPLAREGLATWVKQHPGLALAASVPDGNTALAAIRAHRPALVLMDIQMPGLTGLQVLRALAHDAASRPDAPLPAVIFTTAYNEHALTAFELHAVDYLVKPFTHERFLDAVQHALQAVAARAAGSAAGAVPSAHPPEAADALPALEAAEHAAQQAAAEGGAASTEPLTRVLVRDLGRIVPLSVDQIEHLRSDTKYTAITSRGRSYLVRLPITSFEQRLDPQRFIKLNRSCIVNLDFVEAMTPDEHSQLVVQLRDGTQVTASREVSRTLRAQSL